MIEMSQLSKTFRGGRGIFDITLSIEKGEVFGYLGPNGSGKSTTIRCLMGFLRPDQGTVRISDRDPWTQAKTLHQIIGYLPGDVALPENMTGSQFLGWMRRLREPANPLWSGRLLDRFDLKPEPLIRHMSKGTRQKLALVAAFAHDPDILILDEPTSGLDPLMQQTFIQWLREERDRGKTILLSSHQFAEVDRTCHRVGFLKEGRLVAKDSIQHLRQQVRQVFEIRLSNPADLRALPGPDCEVVKVDDWTATITVHGSVDPLLKRLAAISVHSLREQTEELENTFLELYRHDEGEVEA